MTQMVPIEVPRAVADRVREAARRAHLTEGQLIEEMLERRSRDEFWTQMETVQPDQAYLEEARQWEDALVADTEEHITRFEAGR